MSNILILMNTKNGISECRNDSHVTTPTNVI